MLGFRNIVCWIRGHDWEETVVYEKFPIVKKRKCKRCGAVHVLRQTDCPHCEWMTLEEWHQWKQDIIDGNLAVWSTDGWDQWQFNKEFDKFDGNFRERACEDE
jgi:hypothetical protein